jgi:hypothetical protein
MPFRSDPRTDPVGVTPSSRFQASVQALGDLYDRAVDAVLIRPHEIATADEAFAALRADASWNAEALTSQARKAALVALPIVRRVGLAGRIPGLRGVPSVALVATVAAVSSQLWSVVKELQVLTALIATRLRAAGYPSDPPLVKRLAIEFYSHPGRQPNLEAVSTSIKAMLARMTVAGMFGRTSITRAHEAFVAAERLDVDAVMARWPTSRPTLDQG